VFLLWPAIEAYWLSACSLLLLAPPPLSEAKETHDGVPWFAAKDFESRAQLFGKTLYAQGELSYLEVSIHQSCFCLPSLTSLVLLSLRPSMPPH